MLATTSKKNQKRKFIKNENYHYSIIAVFIGNNTWGLGIRYRINLGQ